MPVTPPPMVETETEIDLPSVRAARVLGRGALGTVFLAFDPAATREPYYALKVFDKRSSSPAGTDAARRARWEVSVLSQLAHHPHPHLPSLLGRAETAELLAWALPYCPGGDLNQLRHAQPDRVFSPAAIRFYVAEVVSALAALHAAGIAYRDLKPENVLLQADGHLMLTDFDLSRHLLPSTPSSPSNCNSTSTSSSCSSPPPPPQAQRHRYYHHVKNMFKRTSSAVTASASSGHHHGQEEEPRNLAWYLNRNLDEAKKAKSARVSPMADNRGGKKKVLNFITAAAAAGERSRSFSFVGTEEYVAPEVVRGDGHEFAVDWWALGVLVYEMCHGRTPFRGRSRRETFRNVLLREPEFTADARRRWPRLTDLVERLLEKDPARRLGFAGGADEVRAHPFFDGVAWDLLGEVSRPPYIPSPPDDDIVVNYEGLFSVVEYFDKIHRHPMSPAVAEQEHSLAEEEERLPEF